MSEARHASVRWERRLEHMRRVLSEGFCTCEFGLAQPGAACGGEFNATRVGAVEVFRYRGRGAQTATRLARHVAADGADHYLLYLPHDAHICMQQDGRSAELAPGTFAFVASGRPFHGLARPLAQRAAFASTHVRIPAAMLRERLPRIDDWCNRPQALRAGSGRVLAALTDALVGQAAAPGAASAAAIGASLVDLVADTALEARRDGTPETGSRRARLLARAQDCIATRLADPELDPAAVARACGVSLRTLHAAFEGRALSLAAAIREARLLACHQALRDPQYAAQSVTEIALARGFSDAAHFGRLYKARFGRPPGRDRRATG